jgi:hypothetical protein
MIRTNRIFLAANLKDFDMMNPAEFLISKCCRKSQGKMRKEWSIEAANMEKFSWSIGELVNYKTTITIADFAGTEPGTQPKMRNCKSRSRGTNKSTESNINEQPISRQNELFFNLRVGKWDLPKWDLHQK